MSRGRSDLSQLPQFADFRALDLICDSLEEITLPAIIGLIEA